MNQDNQLPQPQAADAQLQQQDVVVALQQMQGMLAQQHQAWQQQQQVMQQAMQQQQQDIQALQQQLAAAAPQAPPAAPVPAQQPPPQAPAHINIKVPKPEMFSGQKPTALTGWLLAMSNYLETQHVNLASQEAVRYAAAYLKDAALEWYHLQLQQNNSQIPFADFAAFRQALQRYLLPVDPAKTARQAMDQLRQRTSAQQYVTAFNTLLLQLPDMSEGGRIHNFVKGLKYHVKREVTLRGPATLSQAMEIAITADNALYNASKEGPRALFGNTPGQPSNGPAPMELGAHQGVPQGELQSFKCYKCGKEGHVARNCRSGGEGRGRGRGGKGRGRGRFNPQREPPN
jgi:hypothetical protein